MSNHRRAEFQRLFHSMHAQAANACAVALTTTINSFPFFARHSAVFIAGIHRKFVKPKRSQMVFIEKGVCIREAKQSTANDNRRCKSD